MESETISVPPDIRSYLESYSRGSLTDKKSRSIMLAWLDSALRDETRGREYVFNLLKDMGMDNARIAALERSIRAFRRRYEASAVETKAEETVKKTLAKAADTTAKDLAMDVYNTAKSVVNEYTKFAVNRGMKLEDYIRAAVEFYEEFSDDLENMRTENEELKALTQALIDLMQPRFFMSLCAKIMGRFELTLAQIQAMSASPLPPQTIDFVTSQLKSYLNEMLEKYVDELYPRAEKMVNSILEGEGA
jgi:hypothetical protein